MAVAKPRWLPIPAAVEAAVGALTLAGAVYYLQEIYAFTSSIGMSPLNFPDFYSYFGVLAAAAAAALAIAFGVWKRARWGFTAGTYLGVAYLVFCVGFGSYFVATYGDYTEMVAGLPLLAASLALVFYLDRPGVRANFLGPGPEAADPQVPV